MYSPVVPHADVGGAGVVAHVTLVNLLLLTVCQHNVIISTSQTINLDVKQLIKNNYYFLPWSSSGRPSSALTAASVTAVRAAALLLLCCSRSWFFN